MPLGPNNRSDLTTEDLKAVISLCTQIDGVIERKFDGISVLSVELGRTTYRVREEIRRRYTEAGWNVEIVLRSGGAVITKLS